MQDMKLVRKIQKNNEEDIKTNESWQSYDKMGNWDEKKKSFIMK